MPQSLGPRSIPNGVDPLVKQLFELLRGQDSRWIGTKAGVHWNTIFKWREGTTPNLLNFNSVLHAVGYKLVIRPLNERLDDFD